MCHIHQVMITDQYFLGPESCGEDFFSLTGQLSSPNYPYPYYNNLDCYWTITVPDGVVRLDFSDVIIESCTYDWLEVRKNFLHFYYW